MRSFRWCRIRVATHQACTRFAWRARRMDRSCSSVGTGGPAPAQSRSTAARTESTCYWPTRAGILFYGCWCRTIPKLREDEMERTPRFAVAALGAVTLSTVVGASQHPRATGPIPLNGQTAVAVTWHFDSLPAGQPPAGFSFGHTGGGRVGHWIVQSASDAPSPPNVLAQVDSDRTDYRFPVAAALSPSFTDGSVSVKCKPVSGHVDRACGLVFRYGDENNYYLTRANALEDNVRFYYVKNGRRIQLANWSGKVTSGAWHELRVEFQGDHVEVYWDGTKRIDAHDHTFSGSGRVGVWTKADSYTLFDDLTARPLGS